MKQPRKEPIKPESDDSKAQTSVAKIGLISAITVAVVGMIGVVLNAYISSRATQAPILIPIQYTQTAESKLTLESILLTETATTTSVSVARPTATMIPGATLSAAPTAAPATTAAPRVTAPPGTPLPTALPTEMPVSQGTPMLAQAYRLPLTSPRDVVYTDSGLWVLFESRLVKLELVETEGRFRAAEQIVFPTLRSLSWDVARGEYWAVCGPPQWTCETAIELIDRAGNATGTFTVPQTFVGYPASVAWDGEYLWTISDVGTLYKFQPASNGGELMEIDSYATEAGGLEQPGLTWDGEHLWLLVDRLLSKLDQAGRSLCTIDLWSVSPGLPYGWRGVTWDGQFLWVANQGTNKLYRVDLAACQ
jgi:hypothetical protein